MILCLALSARAIGQEESSIDDEWALLAEELSADEVVSASKHRESIYWSPSAISVFTREDIRASGAATLTDLLRRVPGFDVYLLKPSYPIVGARTYSYRENNLVLLLIDGREAIIELTGFSFWAHLTIDLEEIERIEVIRGPGSTLYGANAFAAVVNVTTVAPEKISANQAFLSAGEDGQRHLFLQSRGGTGLGDGRLSFGVGLGLEGVSSPSDSRDRLVDGFRAHGYLRYREEKRLDLSLHAGTWHGDSLFYIIFGDLRARDAATPWVMGKAELALADNARILAQVYYNHHRANLSARAPLRSYGIWMCDLPDLRWVSHTLDAQILFEYQLLDTMLVSAGGNFRTSTVAGKGFVMEVDQEYRGSGLVHVKWAPWEVLQLTGGMRLDLNSETETAPSPRAVLVYKPWDRQSFRLGYGLAFRKPSFLESHVHLEVEDYNGALPEIPDLFASQIGNPDLTNMWVHSFELGWRGGFLGDDLKISVDLFYNIYVGTIVFIADVPVRLGLPDISNSEIRFINLSDTLDRPDYSITAGGEIQLEVQPVEHWQAWCNLGLRTIVTNPIIGHDETTRVEPSVRLNLGGGYVPNSGLRLAASLHFVSDYSRPLVEPDDQLKASDHMFLGEQLQLLGQLAYRAALGDDRFLETGVYLRTPLVGPFREFSGMPLPPGISLDTRSDHGGEQITRLISAYLRASF